MNIPAVISPDTDIEQEIFFKSIGEDFLYHSLQVFSVYNYPDKTFNTLIFSASYLFFSLT